MPRQSAGQGRGLRWSRADECCGQRTGVSAASHAQHHAGLRVQDRAVLAGYGHMDEWAAMLAVAGTWMG